MDCPYCSSKLVDAPKGYICRICDLYFVVNRKMIEDLKDIEEVE